MPTIINDSGVLKPVTFNSLERNSLDSLNLLNSSLISVIPTLNLSIFFFIFVNQPIIDQKNFKFKFILLTSKYLQILSIDVLEGSYLLITMLLLLLVEVLQLSMLGGEGAGKGVGASTGA